MRVKRGRKREMETPAKLGLAGVSVRFRAMLRGYGIDKWCRKQESYR